jgi:hypothetical protein
MQGIKGPKRMFFSNKISAQLSHALGGFLERLVKEIKRRTKVVAAFCNEDTVEKLLYLLGEAWGARRLRGFAEIRNASRTQ